MRVNRHDRMTELAELVSRGATIKAAAVQMGISETQATKYWRMIRDGLGWQAR